MRTNQSGARGRQGGWRIGAVAVEGCTGRRYVVGDHRRRLEAHVGEPADTEAARARKKHAKTDRSDAKLLRELLQSGLPR